MGGWNQANSVLRHKTQTTKYHRQTDRQTDRDRQRQKLRVCRSGVGRGGRLSKAGEGCVWGWGWGGEWGGGAVIRLKASQ